MFEQHSHCSYCGTKFDPRSSWPRHCRGCGNNSYLNPLPVVVILQPIGAGLVVIRRNIEPSRGTLTLPGGYLDSGETWQQGAQRELFEETGIKVPTDGIQLYAVENGLDDTLVIFGLSAPQPQEVLTPFSSKETQEVTLIDHAVELGFPNHTKVVADYFTGRGY